MECLILINSNIYLYNIYILIVLRVGYNGIIYFYFILKIHHMNHKLYFCRRVFSPNNGLRIKAYHNRRP